MAPQFGFNAPTQGLPGQAAGPVHVEGARYEKQAQVTTLTVAATPTNGVYTVRITGPGFDKDGLYSDYSYTAAGAAEGDITAGLKAAIDADERAANLVAAVDADPDLVLNFKELGQAYVVDLFSPDGDISAVLTTDPVKADLPLGIGVVKLADGSCRQPTTGDVAIDIRGVVARHESGIAPTPAVEGVEAGKEVSLITRGPVWVKVEDAVAYGAQAFCRVVATGTEVAGAFRSDADTADAVAINAVFDSTTSGPGMAKLRVLGLPTI